MILYRVEVCVTSSCTCDHRGGNDIAAEWYAKKSDAETAFRQLVKASEGLADVHLDAVPIGAGRAGLCSILNLAGSSRHHLPAENLSKHLAR